MDSKTQASILVGLESVACLVDRCAIYECLYLNDINTQARSATVQMLEKQLIELYANILIYLSKSKRYYSHKTACEFQYGPF